MSDVVAETIVELIKTERFYAELLMNMNRIETTRVPVAGVSITQRINLYINPTKFAELPPKERIAVLKHECEHLLRNHIGRAKDEHPEVFKRNNDVVDNIINNEKFKQFNISADMAINCQIDNIPKWGVFPHLYKLPNNETMEFYLQRIKEGAKNENQGQCEGDEQGTHDSHKLWAESEGDKEELKEKIRQIVNKAAESARNAGQMSNSDEFLVSQLNESKIDWRSQLSNFIARNIETTRESSRKKRNRRYGIKIPGDTKIEELHLGVAIDTSGSISDEQLVQFMTEINKIAKYAKVLVVEADSEVKNIYDYDPRKTYSVKGRGGTAYQPAFDYFNTLKNIDAVIYFGDMDVYDSEVITKPKYPVLWSIVGSQEPPVPWGRKIYIKD